MNQRQIGNMNTTINNKYMKQKQSWKLNVHVEYNKNEKKGFISFENIFNFSFALKNENSLDYIYSINPDKADSISKILFACKIFKTFFSGKIKLDGKTLIEYKVSTKIKRDEKSLDYLIKYWYKIYQLEKLLKSKFSPAEIIKNFDKESFDFSRLERCLLKKTPYRINDFVLKEISFNTAKIDLFNDLKKQIPSDFAFKEIETITFANQDFKLYKVMALFNVIAKDVEISKKIGAFTTIKIIVDNDNDKMYLSEQIFLNEKEADDFFNDKNIKQLKIAIPL